MRAALTVLHRYVGLAIATFLFIAGSTGAIIAWDHELDGWLNPGLTKATYEGKPIPAVELARALEARDPHVEVIYLPLAAETGASQSIFVSPRTDPQTGRAYAVDYNQVFVDPASGEELGRRFWGQPWPIDRTTLIPFLYKLHYSLHLPALWGEARLGLWLMGSVAAVWFLDCFVGFYLTLPRRHRSPKAQKLIAHSARGWWDRWVPAWKIKTGGSRYRTIFDIHRAFGLWAWLLLLIIAFTGFSLALNREILRPVLSSVARVTPTPLDGPAPAADKTGGPSWTLAEIVDRARSEGAAHGIETPLGAIAYNPPRHVYSASFFAPGAHGGVGGVQPRTLYLDGRDGRVLGEQLPWSGTPADVFLQAQFPLHSGRILGTFGRIMMSFFGLAVATLSVSGIIIWWRKRAARVMRQRLHVTDAVRA